MRGRSPTGRVVERAREQGRRLLRTVRIGRPPSQRPLPKVRIDLGPWLPGPVLRVSVGVVALVGAALLATGPVSWTFAILGAVLLVVRPSGIAAGVYAFGLGFLLALAPAAPFAGRSFLLLLIVHLLVQLGAVASSLPWTAVLDLRVLVPPARRFLPVQAGAQLLALAGAALTRATVSVPWLPVLVGAALTAVAWLVLNRLVDTSDEDR
jgi:hypothetical protein